MANTGKTTLHILLLATLLFNSCNGQTQSPPKKAIGETKVITTGKSKIIKTQGSNEYQNVCCGLEDKKGNLWFGTSGEGVYRYDGKLFIQFTIQNGLSSNTVRSILEDKNGNIWIGTKDGLCCFDGKVMKQISINKNSPFQSFSSNSNYASMGTRNEFFSIMQDKKGILWFGATDGVYCYDGKTFTAFFDNHNAINDSNLTLKSVRCIYEDKKGNIWFGSGPMAFEGLCVYDGKALTRVKLKNENWIRSITEDGNGNLLLATRHIGVITFNGENFSDFPTPQNLKKDLLNYIFTDREGHIWYASDYVNDDDITTGGFWRFDGKSFNEFTKKDGLSNTSATFILEDRNRNIWVGTRNNGLYCYNGKTFTNFSE
ncbi:MAG TPA: two-component regulator propeller domain-containing protein [Flavipsychrobacter sp.]|nr:two-component regulator propeller domain-containing protein [Flavipsychrobacter sp.]